MPYRNNSAQPGEWLGQAQGGYARPAYGTADARPPHLMPGAARGGLLQPMPASMPASMPAWRQRQNTRQGLRQGRRQMRRDRWQDRMQQMQQMRQMRQMPYNRPYQGGPVRTMPAREPLLPYGGIMGGQPGYGIGGGLEPKPAQGTPAYQQIQPGYGAPRRGWQY